MTRGYDPTRPRGESIRGAGTRFETASLGVDGSRKVRRARSRAPALGRVPESQLSRWRQRRGRGRDRENPRPFLGLRSDVQPSLLLVVREGTATSPDYQRADSPSWRLISTIPSTGTSPARPWVPSIPALA